MSYPDALNLTIPTLSPQGASTAVGTSPNHVRTGTYESLDVTHMDPEDSIVAFAVSQRAVLADPHCSGIPCTHGRFSFVCVCVYKVA